MTVLVAAAAVIILTMPSAGCELQNESSAAGDEPLTVDRFVLEPLTIEVMIKPNTSKQKIEQLQGEIEALPEVEDVVFTSQEERLEILRKRLGEDEALLPPDLAWELSPTFRITLKEGSDVDTVAAQIDNDPIIDNSPGGNDGVRHHSEPWHLELKDDDTFVLRTESGVTTGTYRIFRDSITLIEESGDFNIYEGEVDGTDIRFEAIPGIWKKE